MGTQETAIAMAQRKKAAHWPVQVSCLHFKALCVISLVQNLTSAKIGKTQRSAATVVRKNQRGS